MSNAANLEIHLRKELQEQGLLGPEDENPKVGYFVNDKSMVLHQSFCYIGGR
jgi:hypothetical protein